MMFPAMIRQKVSWREKVSEGEGNVADVETEIPDGAGYVGLHTRKILQSGDIPLSAEIYDYRMRERNSRDSGP